MSNNAQRFTNRRSKKVAGESDHKPKEKFLSGNQARLNQFIPTTVQKEFIGKIATHTLTFCDSVAGTGKSSSVLFYFVQQYLLNPSLNILIIRTPVEAGLDKVGFLPSDLNAKLQPHFASVAKILAQLLGKDKFEADMGNRIHFDIPNFQLGATWDNTLVLIDECQMLAPLTLKLLLERIGHNSKVVVCGASSQLYTSSRGRGALADAISRFFNKDGNAIFDDVALQKFCIDDVQRSDIVKTVLEAYEGIEME